MIVNSQDGAFFVFWPEFDGVVPEAIVEDGCATLHLDQDILMVTTWSTWADIDVRVALVGSEPETEVGAWEETARHARWNVGGPVLVTEMEFDPGDRTAIPLTHGIYDILWRARTVEFAIERGLSSTSSVAEEHEIFFWKA